MLRISGMFVLLLLVVRGSLVVSTSGNGFANPASSIADFPNLSKEITDIIPETFDKLSIEDISKIVFKLDDATNRRRLDNSLDELHSDLDELLQEAKLLEQIEKSIDYFRKILKRMVEDNKKTSDLVTKFCESENGTKVSKLVLDVYDRIKPAISHNQNSQLQFLNTAKDNDLTDACHASHESLQHLIEFLAAYEEVVKNALVISGSCSVLTRDEHKNHDYDQFKLTTDSLLKSVKDLEHSLQPWAEQYLKTIQNCDSTHKLSDELLAVVTKLWRSIGHISAGEGGIGDKVSEIFDAGHKGSDLLTPGHDENSNVHGSESLNKTAS